MSRESKLRKHARERKDMQIKNKTVLLSYAIISVLYEAAYILEIFKGNRSVGYVLVFSVFVLWPWVPMGISYYRDKSTPLIQYVLCYANLALYSFTVLTGSTDTVHAYIYVMLTVLIVYSNMRDMIVVTVCSVIVNVIDMIRDYRISPYSNEEIVYAEIRLVVMIMIFGFLLALVVHLNRVNGRRLDVIRQKRIIAEEASRAKSEFLSNMSHEIRTPLNTVIGMNEMILRETDNPDLFSYAMTVKNSSSALLSLINDILDVSKIESGEMSIEEANYAISSVYNDAYNMVVERAKDKNLDLSFDTDKTLPALLYGDMTRIRQIFVNILTNAIKYTEEGHVKVTLLGHRLGEKCILEFIVEDSGIGMTQENVEKLFEKYEQFDLKRNKGIEGTGLGMSITRELLNIMGGSIHVDSEPDAGSIFTVRIPQRIIDGTPIGRMDVGSGADGSMEDYYQEQFVAPGATVLCVDDVESNLKVFTNLLKPTQISVDGALSGKEAVLKCCETKYDAIFMDHMMPEMDGIETFHMLEHLSSNLNLETPVIMLTANALSGEREKYLEEGFTDYLTKPIRVRELEDMLEKYISKSKLIYGERTEASRPTMSAIPASAGAPSRDQLEAGAGAPAEAAPAAGPFDHIPGITVTDGLTYCMGSEDFLKEMLDDFANNGRGAKLNEIFATADWENYRIEVHALKSTARTVGLNPLADMALDLEMAAKDGNAEFITANHEPMMKVYEETIAAING